MRPIVEPALDMVRRAVTLVRAGRLLQVSALLTILAAVWFAIAFHGDQPAPLLWLPTPISAVVLAVMYWRTSRSAWLPAVTRRFWRHFAIVGTLVGAAAVVQATDVLRHPGVPGEHTGPLMLSIDGVAVLIIMYALYRLPLARRTGPERLRVTLDAGTVMLATAVFIWHFQTRPALDSGNRTLLVTSAFLVVLAQLAVFAVVKVVLSSSAFVDRIALQLLALAMLAGSLTAPLARVVEAHSPLYITQVTIPVVFFLAACATERQRLAPRPTVGGVTGRRRRTFSVLPYAAVAAVDVLLMTTLVAGDEDAVVVAAGAVLITALVVLRQITAFRDNYQLLDRLDHSATHDALTQLPNRVLFNQRLHRALSRHDGVAVSVILVDLDDFKTVNDTLGHAAGDTLLVTVAERLRETIRTADTVARLGGDEFALVIDDPTGTAAERVIRDVTARLQAGVHLEGRDRPIQASYGVVQGSYGDDPGDLLRRADIAMYEAKARGDGGWQQYTTGMQARGAALDQAAGRLREALDDRQLRLYYQPVVALSDGRVIGAEALIRWQHPTRGVVGPADIIPAAESTGLIIKIGRWVIDEACRQMAAWQTDRPDAAALTINVNASARQLREPTFARDVATALRTHGLEPHRLTIEITESTAVGGGATADTLAELRTLGVRVALDDFGTGQSTLTLLATCPVDQIKLDRSFVPDAGSSVIATAVLQLAHGFGVEAVAEGAETADQARRLRELGYDRAQGYHFARPMPADAFAAFLTAGRSALYDEAA
ncbi:putative bifunctional diguanylate cyclase/phosphodiesterase [Micromonosporaceae bacterium Da 78-11]